MQTNRIAGAFSKVCRCLRIKKKLKRVEAECKRLELLMGGVAEFMIPTLGTVLENGERGVLLFLTRESERCPINSDVHAYALTELRRMAGELTAAAERLEGGAE